MFGKARPNAVVSLLPLLAAAPRKRVTVVRAPRPAASWAAWRAPLRRAPLLRAPPLEALAVASVCAVCFALLTASARSQPAHRVDQGSSRAPTVAGFCVWM